MNKRLIGRIILTIVLTAGLLVWQWQRNSSVQQDAGIGGTFSLIATDGTRVSSDHWPDQYKLVFFGFTHCPDICPTGLQTITSAMETLGEASQHITPLFITVDPERDTAEIMKQYITAFHPRLIGLTGSKEEVKQAIDAYRVYASRQEMEGEDSHYLMNHSGYIYLMDKEGRYLTHFNSDSDVQTMASTIRQHTGL